MQAPRPDPARRRNRWWRRLTVGLAITAVLLLVGAAFGGWTLARPPRRPLQEYHRKYLDDPAGHGLHIQAARAGGTVPYLCCRPDARSGAGKRGSILRGQLTADGQLVPAYGFTRGTVVLLHGRKGRKEDLLPVAERYCAAGFRCLLVDLPGHGENPAAVCGYGAGTADAGIPGLVLEDAAARFGFSPKEPVALWGMSMGGSFALYAAGADPKRFAAVVIACSYPRLDAVLKLQARRWTGPLAPLVYRLAVAACQASGGPDPAAVLPVDQVRRYRGPVLVLHGTADPLIPQAHGREIYLASDPRRRQWIEVIDANHQNLLITPQQVFAASAAWLTGECFPAVTP